MRERGIIFSGESVRAILEGRKTQTRRVIKGIDANIFPYCGSFDTKDGLPFITFSDYPGDQAIDRISAPCPFGLPGDRLWVRETWAPYDEYVIPEHDRSGVGYKADGWGDSHPNESMKWHSSIDMPRWALRLVVENTGIKAERLQSISEEDATAEGCGFGETHGLNTTDERRKWNQPARENFANLWDSLYANPKPVHMDGKIHLYVSYPWEPVNEARRYRGKIWYIIGNPWVFAISFRKVDL